MAIRSILQCPHPTLREKSKSVEIFDNSLRLLVDDMFETVDCDDDSGLAAPQIGTLSRVIILNMDKHGGHRRVYVNPVFLEKSNETILSQEGCLSVRDRDGDCIQIEVLRSVRVKIRYQDLDGAFHEEEASDYPAIGFQHEIDHLNGVLLVDYLSPVKRDRVMRALRQKA